MTQGRPEAAGDPGGAGPPDALVARIESLGRRQLVRCGDLTLTWRTWGAGPPLLLLHGASGSWTHWIRNVIPLAVHFRVFAPDLPGFGDSDTPPEPHTAEALADFLMSAIDAIVPPPVRLDIAGFSFGGIVAGLAAARLGDRVRTLALVGPGGFGLPRSSTRPLRPIRPAMSADEIRLAHRENLGILMIADAGRVDDLAVHLHMDNIRRARFKSGTIPDSDVLLRALPGIRARITGLWGSRDAFAGANLQTCREILAAVQRDLDFRVIDGVGHWAIYEAPDPVNAALLDMLRVHP